MFLCRSALPESYPCLGLPVKRPLTLVCTLAFIVGPFKTIGIFMETADKIAIARDLHHLVRRGVFYELDLSQGISSVRKYYNRNQTSQ
jgi:hypothetical protein